MKLKMKNNIFMDSDCLTEEQIINYKAHNLSGGELRKIEEHLIDCSLCSEAVEGLEKLDAENMQDDFFYVKKELKNRTTKRYSKVFIYSAVAALLLLAGTAIFNISSPSNSEVLFNKYFQVYPDVTVHKRGVSQNSRLTDAMDYYNQKQFQKASGIFMTIIKKSNNETAVFYNGISLMAINHNNQALKYFIQICNDTENSFYNEANWYAALSLIAVNKTGEAKKYLKKLTNSYDYKDAAKDILKQLTNPKK